MLEAWWILLESHHSPPIYQDVSVVSKRRIELESSSVLTSSMGLSLKGYCIHNSNKVLWISQKDLTVKRTQSDPRAKWELYWEYRCSWATAVWSQRRTWCCDCAVDNMALLCQCLSAWPHRRRTNMCSMETESSGKETWRVRDRRPPEVN